MLCAVCGTVDCGIVVLNVTVYWYDVYWYDGMWYDGMSDVCGILYMGWNTDHM